MSEGEIWQFDNGIAYDLCRIVRADPPTAIHASGEHSAKSAYLINPNAEGWSKVGESTTPLTFNVKLPDANTKKARHNPT